VSSLGLLDLKDTELPFKIFEASPFVLDASALQQLQHGVCASWSWEQALLDGCVEGHSMLALEFGDEVLRGDDPLAVNDLH
jgi:hypothetical protein